MKAVSGGCSGGSLLRTFKAPITIVCCWKRRIVLTCWAWMRSKSFLSYSLQRRKAVWQRYSSHNQHVTTLSFHTVFLTCRILFPAGSHPRLCYAPGRRIFSHVGDQMHHCTHWASLSRSRRLLPGTPKFICGFLGDLTVFLEDVKKDNIVQRQVQFFFPVKFKRKEITGKASVNQETPEKEGRGVTSMWETEEYRRIMAIIRTDKKATVFAE